MNRAAYTRANQGVRVLIRRDLTAWWATLDHRDAYGVRAAMEDVLPRLVERYGAIAATVAADWYASLRADAGRSGGDVVLADAPDVEAVRANGRWAIGHLFGVPDPVAALALLVGVADAAALGQGKATVALNAARDGVRWERVPVGKTCDWCLSMAGEYTNPNVEANTYHRDCDCTPRPMF